MTNDEPDLYRKIRAFNTRPRKEGVEPCEMCGGWGEIAVERNGEMVIRVCSCEIKRRSLARVRRSGLGELYEAYTMDNYNTDMGWQAHLKQKAKDYLKESRGWFFLCGKSGSGKSHLTCAIAREFLEAGKKVRYMRWRQEAPQLKAMVNEREDYENRMRELTSADVLVIDDLFKGRVTEADINLAFELIDTRYNQPSRRTIISSERSMPELLELDEAVGGRIAERARGYALKTGDVNLRLGGGDD